MTPDNRQPKTGNRLFHIITFGCKVNQCDTAGMARELTARGWCAASPGAEPDLVIVNTCTVTARADQQARQTIRRLAREHPETPLWVTGCYGQRAPAEVAALPGVQTVFGNQEKADLGHLLSNYHQWRSLMSGSILQIPGPHARDLCRGGLANRPYENPYFSKKVKNIFARSTGDVTLGEAASPGPLMGEGGGGGENIPPSSLSPLPIGEGEEVIFPQRPLNPGRARTGALGGRFRRRAALPTLGSPRRRSRPHPGLAQNPGGLRPPVPLLYRAAGPRPPPQPGPRRGAGGLSSLASLGYREVVLTGVDLGQYGLDHTPPLQSGSASSSSYGKGLALPGAPFFPGAHDGDPGPPGRTGGLGRFLPHFHLPLQSGAAPVLAAMGRPYGPEEFRDLVREITRRFPGRDWAWTSWWGFPARPPPTLKAPGPW